MNKSALDRSSFFILSGVVACFILSGFAALLYQTAWMREFSTVFGTSELAVAAVLAAYMGGLAFGSSMAAKYVNRVTRPVLFYGLLEAGIALAALAVPLLLWLASSLYVNVLGGQPEPVDARGLGQSFFYLLVAFIVLAIPTSFMGATLPLLTKYVVKSREQIGSRVGLLYATNTLGAIAGTVVAGFVLLPLLGLNGTVWVGVGINFLVFLLAAAIAKKVGDHMEVEGGNADAQDPDKSTHSSANKGNASKARLWILPIMLFSGANAFLYEVLWTRLLGHILGGSIAAFSTMLAGFLSGIAIGSAIASRLAKTRERSTNWFVLVQCGIAFTSMLIYALLPTVIPESKGLAGNVVLAIMILLPATIFIGATFPLAVRILAFDERDAAPSSAKVYSWNTVGAIFGATISAFFLIPALKYEGAILFAVLVNIGLAFAAATMLGYRRASLQVAIGMFIVGTILFYKPLMPEAILRTSPIFTLLDGEFRYYEVGRSSTVTVIERNGYLNIRNNGLPEASAAVKGAPPAVHNQRLLAITPVLARPDAENMLVVGLGGGVALEGVPKSIKSVDVIELEEQVIDANQTFGDERAIDPLKDPRMNLVINDARSAMTLTEKNYDAIVSQPSHPWTAGASHLYTREYMALAKERLTEDGVYLQWMNTQFVDEFLLRSLTATMLDVYPYVRMYKWNGEAVFFLGSNSPLNIEQDIARTGRPLSDDPQTYLENGLGAVEDVIAGLAMDQKNLEEFAKGGKVITDNNNYMATHSSRVIDTPSALTWRRLDPLLANYDPVTQIDSEFYQPDLFDLDLIYLTRRLENLRLKPRAVAIGNFLESENHAQSLAVAAAGLMRQGDREQGARHLLDILEREPDNQRVRYLFLQPWLSEKVSGKELPEDVEAQFALLSGTALTAVEALAASTENRMNDLAQMDAELAKVLPTDPWYDTTTKLRADWRIRVNTPGFQPRFANEATEIVDRALVFTYDLGFYAYRLRSTEVAKDFVSSVEAGRIMVSTLENLNYLQSDSSNTPPQSEVQRNLGYANSIDKMLKQVEGKQIEGVSVQKVENVRQRLDVLLGKLNGLAGNA